MSDNYTIDENGNVTISFKMNLFGYDQDVTLTTTLEKIAQQNKNIEDPNSREKEIIEDDEVVVPFEEFFKKFVLGTVGLDGDIGKRMFEININARAEGYNNVVMKKADYDTILKNRKV